MLDINSIIINVELVKNLVYVLNVALLMFLKSNFDECEE